MTGVLPRLSWSKKIKEPVDKLFRTRPELYAPQDLRYKEKGHELSSLYPSRPEPRLHLLSVVRPEVRYERVGAAEDPCEERAHRSRRGRCCLGEESHGKHLS